MPRDGGMMKMNPFGNENIFEVWRLAKRINLPAVSILRPHRGRKKDGDMVLEWK
jgi:hypothetical protein